MIEIIFVITQVRALEGASMLIVINIIMIRIATIVLILVECAKIN